MDSIWECRRSKGKDSHDSILECWKLRIPSENALKRLLPSRSKLSPVKSLCLSELPSALHQHKGEEGESWGGWWWPAGWAPSAPIQGRCSPPTRSASSSRWGCSGRCRGWGRASQYRIGRGGTPSRRGRRRWRGGRWGQGGWQRRTQSRLPLGSCWSASPIHAVAVKLLSSEKSPKCLNRKTLQSVKMPRNHNFWALCLGPRTENLLE